MIRLYIVVEGATEETFASEILYPHLMERGVYLSARRIGKPGHKGGQVSYARASKDLLPLLRQEANTCCTTFFDFYGLGEGFGIVLTPFNATVEQKAESIEKPFHAEIVRAMGHAFHPARFIPYIQMHEFEGLLFSDPAALASEIGKPLLKEQLIAIRSAFRTPEDIDDGDATAPSKRIKAVAPEYDKVFHGNLAARKIGLATIRKECPHFDAWITRLESLRSGAGSSV